MKQHRIIGLILMIAGIIANPWIIIHFIGDGTIDNPLKLEILGLLSLSIIMILFGFLYFKQWIVVSYKDVIATSFSIIFMLVLLEFGLRLVFWIQQRSAPETRELATNLGWQSKENVTKTSTHPVFGEVDFSTSKYGFRRFGDLETEKLKVFVIGDSFTYAGEVSDGETYYDHVGDGSDSIEIFAYGCGGFGTLQEYMILDLYLDTIQPDLVLWQFCSNDLINNRHELESQSFENNNLMVRPYLVDGEIEMLFPKQNQGLVKNLMQSSYLIRFINTRINILMAENYDSTIEDQLKRGNPLLTRAENTTKEILQKVERRLNGIPMVAFSVDEKWEQVFIDICKSLDIDYITGIPQTIATAKASGQAVDGSPVDTHWNKNGHKIGGQLILDYLENGHLLGRDSVLQTNIQIKSDIDNN